ncbi:MAG: chromate transporter [Betaproteobacteria bacterium]|nr:chromate transporter [Betaproteobacteria bacterium]
MQQEDLPLARPASPTDLFLSFTALALQGFGGVIAVAQRVLCEEKRWLARQDFLELLAASQVLPGPNICNLALMIGDRFHGWRGAFAALAGMMSVPLMIVLVLTEFYSMHALNPVVAGALRGMGGVSAGLIAGTALRLAPALKKSPMGIGACVLVAATCFVAVAILRWPLVWILLVLGTLSCLFALKRTP